VNIVDQLTLLSEEVPASHSVSPEDDLDLMTRVVTWPFDIWELLAEYGRRGSYLKMSLDFCRLEKDKTSAPSSKRWMTSGIMSRGRSWTLNGSDWPKDVSVCSLSDTLETGDIPQRYYLSPTACSGILRRAAKRKRTLPEPLMEALTAGAEAE
jgi:hypothetical protein